MSDHSDALRGTAPAGLGWSDFFADQCGPTEADLAPMRIAKVHRARLTAPSAAVTVELQGPVQAGAGDVTVGDWVLVDPRTPTPHRRLSRKTVLQRRTEGGRIPQAAAANVDTLFVVTSCNDDFDPARLERYLALANPGGTAPVILLTKADLTDDVEAYRRQAAPLQRDLSVVPVNPRHPDAAAALAPWCGAGRTVALAGSSRVGKSTLVNTLAGPGQDAPQETGAIRERDAKGRHTTTARSLHAMAGGGWVIDTPGMRTLHVGDAAERIGTLFAEITERAPACRFRDRTHAPGCAVQAAIADGSLDPERLDRWRKLVDENRDKTLAPASRGGRKRRSDSSGSRVGRRATPNDAGRSNGRDGV